MIKLPVTSKPCNATAGCGSLFLPYSFLHGPNKGIALSLSATTPARISMATSIKDATRKLFDLHGNELWRWCDLKGHEISQNLRDFEKRNSVQSEKKYSKSLIVKEILKRSYACNFVVSTVPADAPAPLGATASAGIVMTNIRCRIRYHNMKQVQVLHAYGTVIWRVEKQTGQPCSPRCCGVNGQSY